ncbi:MAG TPA: RsmE family RNA methyltransferase, partial [Candidatus Deferrimicrobiaceae bacterium]
AKKRLLRWERVALAAAKQCGSGRVPKIEGILPFADALRIGSECGGRVVFYEGVGTFGLRKVLGGMEAVKSIALLVGPEGGFSEAEVREAEDAGFVRAGLGPRILRVETAAVAVLGMVNYEFENE